MKDILNSSLACLMADAPQNVIRTMTAALAGVERHAWAVNKGLKYYYYNLTTMTTIELEHLARHLGV
jgi:hypothetical protein